MIELPVILFAVGGFFALLGLITFAVVLLAIGLEVADRIEFYTNSKD